MNIEIDKYMLSLFKFQVICNENSIAVKRGAERTVALIYHRIYKNFSEHEEKDWLRRTREEARVLIF